MWLDIRESLRSWRRRPSVAALGIVTLAVGLAASSTMFSAVRALAFDRPPISNLDRVAHVWRTDPSAGVDRQQPTLGDARRWRTRLRTVDALGAYTSTRGTLRGDGLAIEVAIRRADPELLEALGVRCAFGPCFDGSPASRRGPGVVLSHRFWQRQFGADPDVLGRRAVVDGEPRTVVGVLPEGFWFQARGDDVWLPFDVEAPPGQAGPDPAVGVIVRARPAASWQAVEGELRAVVAAELRAGTAGTTGGVRVVPIDDELTKRAGLGLFGLFGPSVVLLLLAVGNVVNLLLVRAADRRRELAVRCALGAAPGRLVRLMLVDGAVLAAPAGVLGLAVTCAAASALRAQLSAVAPAQAEAIRVGGPVLVFTLLVTALLPALTGLLPGVCAARAATAADLAGHARSTRRPRGGYGLADLVAVLQVGLAVVLVVVAVLIGRFIREVTLLRPGHDTSRLLVVEASIPASRYREPVRRQAYWDEAESRLRRVPGVASVALASGLPGPRARRVLTVTPEGGSSAAPAGPTAVAVTSVSPTYVTTVGQPIRYGRDLAPSDTAGAERVALIGEGAARRLWPGRPAVGARLRLAGRDSPEASVTIVGVVADDLLPSPVLAVIGPPRVPLLVPLSQAPSDDLVAVASTRLEPGRLVASVRREIAAIDPDVIVDVAPLDDVYAAESSGITLVPRLLAIGAVMSLALAAAGVFGVFSAVVVGRRRDVGIRAALGAGPCRVVRAVLGPHLALMAIGLVAGAAGTLGVTRVMWAELAASGAIDPFVWAGVAVPLVVAAVAATLGPARRLLSIDPIEALRCE